VKDAQTKSSSKEGCALSMEQSRNIAAGTDAEGTERSSDALMDDLIKFKKEVSAKKHWTESLYPYDEFTASARSAYDETTETSSPGPRFPATASANQEMKQKFSSGDLSPSQRLRLSLDCICSNPH
jgi:hypothetical protein